MMKFEDQNEGNNTCGVGLKLIDVAMKIKDARKKKGLSVKQAATLCNIKINEYEKIENADITPDLDVLCVILKVLNIKV